MLSRKVADRLKEFDTPFYLYDIDLLRQTLDSAVAVASKYGFRLHYAIKANYDPKILSVIKEYGLGIDCASGNEIRCAIEAGFAPAGIVYAGVGKKDKEIKFAIEQGIFSINVESMEELWVIDRFAGEMGRKVDAANIRPGDLVFYANSNGVVDHVAIYIGNNQIVHAASTKAGIKISNYNYRTPKCIRNVLGKK